MTKRREDYSRIELELDEAQEILVRVFMFEGALSERERMTADLEGLAKTKTVLTVEEVQELISGKDIVNE
jgi:hypothetical protein